MCSEDTSATNSKQDNTDIQDFTMATNAHIFFFFYNDYHTRLFKVNLTDFYSSYDQRRYRRMKQWFIHHSVSYIDFDCLMKLTQKGLVRYTPSGLGEASVDNDHQTGQYSNTQESICEAQRWRR